MGLLMGGSPKREQHGEDVRTGRFLTHLGGGKRVPCDQGAEGRS